MEPPKLPQKEEIHNALEQGEEAVVGLFYLVWFPMMGRDLLRLGRSMD